MQRKIAAILVALNMQLLSFHGAQAFPDRPIKLVVASPAGSPPDVIARLVSDKMADVLGQPVIVENRPGAGGTIGSRMVLSAEPDGYTMLLGSTSNPAHRARGLQERRLRCRKLCTDRACGRHQRGSCRASVGRCQIRRRIDRSREVAAGRAELCLGREWNAAAYRRRVAQSQRQDRNESRSL